AIALLKDPKKGAERWQALLREGIPIPDLSGADLRKVRLHNVSLWAKLDGADLRGADLTRGSLSRLTGARLDRIRLIHGGLGDCTDCSFRGAHFRDARWNPIKLLRCDFTGAKAPQVRAWHTVAEEVVFRNVDFTEAEFPDSRFLN